MDDYKDLQGYPLQAGQGLPFAGRLVDSERNENGVFVRIPFDMLNNAGLYGANKVEVWGNGWNDIFPYCNKMRNM